MSGAPEMELTAGRTYRAKRPKPVGFLDPLFDDRTILWIGLDEVQYDGPSVKFGRKFPKVSKAAFLRWADRDVTDELPAGEYASWPKQPTSHGAGVSK